MLTISVDAMGILRLRQTLENLPKQQAFATMRALNSAAYQATKATSEEMARVFDRPTPWVLKSVRYVKAKRDRLEAQVDFDFWGNKQGVTVSHVLQAEIHGGARKLKRHELALRRAGVLPDGMAIVPGPAAKMDAFGNMSGGQIVQIMSWFQAFPEQGYRANMRDGGKRLASGNRKIGARGFAYFALYKRHGKLIPGIYQRITFGTWGSAVKPVMYFVRIPRYRRRLDFYGLAERKAREVFAADFPRFLEEAMRTAR